MSFIIVAFYTKNSIYEEYSKKLKASLEKFHINYDIKAIDSLGCWDKNTHYKPKFIREMLDKHLSKSVVYVDVDAEFLQYPTLFGELTCDVAVHLLDHTKYRRRQAPPEILSGTIYFGNTEKTREIVEQWNEICKQQPTLWDQAALQQILVEPDSYYNLPPQYCVIFDYMGSVIEPVIKHYQASREQRRIEKLRKS